MSTECDFCGRHASLAGELRMAPDYGRGGAYFPTCHDCHDDGLACDGDECPWADLDTVDEWAAGEAGKRELLLGEHEGRAGL